MYYYACHEYWCKYRTMYLYVLRFEFNDITKMLRRDIQGCLNIHHINWQETTPFRMNCSHPAMLIHWMSCPRSAGKARKVARCLTIVWTQLLAMMIGKDRQCPYFSRITALSAFSDKARKSIYFFQYSERFEKLRLILVGNIHVLSMV